MKRVAFVVLALSLHATAQAQKLTCAQDERTFATMCFADNGVRENGPVRSAKLYKGGPKGASVTSFTARAHCRSLVLELTDREGVAFARNVPPTQLGKDFVDFLCRHSPTKHDPKLSTK